MVSNIDNITSIPDIKGTHFKSEAEITAAIERYLQNVTDSGRVPPPSGDILTFFELVQNAVWSRQATENIPEDKRLIVLGDDPPEEDEIDSEAITFTLEKRDPGQWSQGRAGSGGVREVAHHQRSIQQHPEHLGEKLVTMGRAFDNVIEFHTYARTDFRSLKRALWFENVMDGFRWYFRLHRITTVQQTMRRVGKVVVGELPLVKYSVRFFARTEDTYQIGLQELKKIVLNVNMSTN